MFYIIIRNSKDDLVTGFVTDEDERPMKFTTEAEAKENMKGHILQLLMEIVEL